MTDGSSVHVVVAGDFTPDPAELQGLQLHARYVGTEPGSDERGRVIDEQLRFSTEQHVIAARLHADGCPWWDLRGYVSRFQAWRSERELEGLA